MFPKPSMPKLRCENERGKMNYPFKKHSKRQVRFLELWLNNNWKIKIYGISQLSEKPEEKFVEIAKQLAEETLLKHASENQHYGTAFITIHRAEMFNQIIIDWWERVNELRHHVFKAEPANPYYFKNITATGEAFCIWELSVISFERDAWYKHVLNAKEENINNYLNTVLNKDI